MSGGGGGGANANPWAWLGLLKWSLSYTDGTRDSSDSMQPMSAEDRAFLEKVMSEGIIDENKRMKYILEQAALAMEYYQTVASVMSPLDKEQAVTCPPPTLTTEGNCPVPEEDLLDLLQELQDIVEQIDYARAFCSMKGLPFLLGCIANVDTVIPESIRFQCLGIVATLCQNNPPVQQQLLELGSFKVFSDVYFQCLDQVATNTTATVSSSSNSKYTKKFPAKVMQVISANVRNHALCESVFTQLEQAPELILSGLNGDSAFASSLQSRTLFFLRALVTSDHAHVTTTNTDQDDETKESANIQRMYLERFQPAVATVLDQYLLVLNPNDKNKTKNCDTPTTTAAAAALPVNPELTELALGMVDQLLVQTQRYLPNHVDDDPTGMLRVIVQRSNALMKVGKHERIPVLEQLTGDEREFAQVELDHWTSIVAVLSQLVIEPQKKKKNNNNNKKTKDLSSQ
jgi:hypothetical protein